MAQQMDCASREDHVLSVTSQLLTIAAVVVGAITSFTATSFNDRRRFHREQATHWADRKLEAYLDYLNAVKEMNRLSRRIAAARGIGHRVPALDSDEALSLLAEAEGRRANASEKVALLGDAATVTAIRELNKEAWRLEWVARGLLQPDQEAWEASNQSLIRASNRLHERIRVELGVPGAFLARDVDEPYQPVLPDHGATAS